MLVISDLHLGVDRQAGTTPLTQVKLREYLQSWLVEFLQEHKTDHLCINGDLFDKFSVDPMEVIRVFNTFADWLNDTKGILTLIAGNHDSNPRGDKVSSFALLTHFLQRQFPKHVNVINVGDGFTRVWEETWAVPHMENQDTFDLALQAAIDSGEHGFLLLHANVMSTFCENSDHSLNVSEAQIDALIAAGWTLVFGHEHVGKTLKGRKVIVVGNQIPSSIVDCIGDSDKHALVLDENHYTLFPTWCADWPDGFEEVAWHDLAFFDSNKKFIRVTGDCSAEQAADMVNAVAKFRQRSTAFVVGNAVRVAGMAEMDELASLSMENVSKFDVMGALLETLDEREQEVVKGLVA